MIQAFFLDFYGTVVHEDGDIIRRIRQEIYDTGDGASREEIGTYWWKEFYTSFLCAYGENFRTQRELEYRSLAKTVRHFHSSANAAELCELLFAHWRRPPIFPEAGAFLARCPVPVYIVSNIDRADIMDAIAFHGLKPDGVFTSEDARSYKPRGELFAYALKSAGLMADQVVHIGDSLSSDISGAASVGIQAIWLNRSAKEVPPGVTAIGDLTEAFDTPLLEALI